MNLRTERCVGRLALVCVLLGSCVDAPSSRAEEPARPATTRCDALGDPLPDGAIYRVGTTRLLHGGGTSNAVQLYFSPDGKLLLSGDLHEICFWDVATGRQVRRLPAAVNLVFTMSADGTRLAIRRHLDIQIHDAISGKELRALGSFPLADFLFAFSPDGKTIAAGGQNGRIRLWETATGHECCPFDPNPGGVVQAVFSPDARRLAVTFDNKATHLLDAVNGRALHRLPECRFLAFSPDGGRMLMHCGDELLRIVDADNGEERVRLRGSKGERFGAWSPDGKAIVTLGRDDPPLPIRIWDSATGEVRREVQGIKNVSSAESSSNGRIIVVCEAGESGRIHLLAADTGQELRRLEGTSKPLSLNAYRRTKNSGMSMGWGANLSPLLSPDGRLLLAGHDKNSFAVWDVNSGKQLFRGSFRELLPTKPSFSWNGSLLVLRDRRGDPCLVEAATGEVRQRLTRQEGDLFWMLDSVSYAFSPDSRLLAAAYDAETLVLWETATGQPIRTWPGHGKARLRQMMFSPDNRRLATVGSDGTTLVWDVTGRSADGRLAKQTLTAEQSKRAWRDLADMDAAKAHCAVWNLIAAPDDALAYLRPRLKPVDKVDDKRMARWIAELDSDEFRVRDQATEQLHRLGELAEPALRKAMTSRPSLEMRRRMQQLLEDVAQQQWQPSGEQFQRIRAVEVLERIGTLEARKLLQTLAEGASGARLTREARDASQRLTVQQGAKP